MARYRVSRHASLMHNGTHIEPGTIIPVDMLTTKQIEEKVRLGFLVAVGSETDTNEKDVGVDPKTIPVKAEIDTKRTPGELKDVNPQKARAEAVGKWRHDPKSLEKKTLDELNTMVLETDHNIVPFNTRQEAIAQLSYDLHR